MPARDPDIAAVGGDDERSLAGLYRLHHCIRGGIHNEEPVLSDEGHPDLARDDVRVSERCRQVSVTSGNAPLAGSGTTYEHTFNDAGTFAYFCSSHWSLGMMGMVVVQP